MNKVVVIGGGLAGLTAAFRIQKDQPDLKVTVLEANSYPGGRMLTTEYGGEAGGESIGFYYGALQALAEEAGVSIDSSPITLLNDAFNIAYYWKDTGEWIEQKNWPLWKNNPFPPELRKMPPIMLLRVIADQVPHPSNNELLEDPAMRDLAGKSLLELLKERKVPESVYPFIESNFEVNEDLSRISAFSTLLKSWITPKISPDSRYYYVRGGNQQFPLKLAESVDVKYNHKVSEIRNSGERYHVKTADGEEYEADFVILTVPTGPMKEMKITPPLTGIQKEAFDNIRYTPSVKVFYKISSPFWEKDHLPLFMWTNTNVNMVVPVFDKDTRESPITGSKVWGLYVLSNGLSSEELSKIEKNQGIPVHKQCLTILETIRPSIKGCLEHVETVDWGSIPTAQGAFNYYSPSPHVVDYFKALSTPFHKMFFAGDHTEFLSKGFDAAVNSGIRAAQQLAASRSQS